MICIPEISFASILAISFARFLCGLAALDVRKGSASWGYHLSYGGFNAAKLAAKAAQVLDGQRWVRDHHTSKRQSRPS